MRVYARCWCESKEARPRLQECMQLTRRACHHACSTAPWLLPAAQFAAESQSGASPSCHWPVHTLTDSSCQRHPHHHTPTRPAAHTHTLHPTLVHHGRVPENDYSSAPLYDCLCETVEQHPRAASVISLCALGIQGSSCAAPDCVLMQVYLTCVGNSSSFRRSGGFIALASQEILGRVVLSSF